MVVLLYFDLYFWLTRFRLCVLCTYNHQGSRLLYRPNTASYSSSGRCGACFGVNSRLRLRSYGREVALYSALLCAHDHWSCHASRDPQTFFGTICWYMPDCYGGICRRPTSSLLVCHESRWPYFPKYRYSLDDRLWKYWGHCRHLRIFSNRSPKLYPGICCLPSCYQRRLALRRSVRWSDLGGKQARRCIFDRRINYAEVPLRELYT